MLRHGLTAGNMEKRYIGRTDEPLCDAGIKALEGLRIPTCELLLSSPMLRCVQTAEVLFPGQEAEIIHDFRECDFGDFEGKNYAELNGNQDYQKWIDSGGEMQFPGGERPADFKERCCRAFISATKAAGEIRSMAMIVHGGTIMSVLERFAVPRKGYYDWSVPNGHGYLCEFDKKEIKVLEKL